MTGDEVRSQIRARRVLLFCGAGISLDYPAGLPDWHQLRDDMVDALTNQHATAARHAEALKEFPMLALPGKRGMTPEVVASIIRETTPRFFDSLVALDDGQPNANHLLLAQLAAADLLPVIVTTNWDRFLERALEQVGASFSVYRTDAEFSRFPEVLEPGTCHLAKLHGCLSIPETITATVEQEARGLSEPKLRVCDRLLRDFTYIFWGYSGADLKIDLDYLRMLTVLEQARGFVWSLYKTQDYEETPSPQVVALKERYGQRALVVPGWLPDAVEDLVERAVAVPAPPADRAAWGESRRQKVRSGLNAWADEHIGGIESCCSTGSLLMANGALDGAATCYTAMEELGHEAEDADAVGAALNNLGNVSKASGQHAAAVAYYRKALDYARDEREAMVRLRNAGDVLGRMGRIADAMSAYGQAADLAKELGDDKGAAVVQASRAQVLGGTGQREEAIELYRQAEGSFAALGEKAHVAEALVNRAGLHRILNELDAAEECLNRAADISRALGDRLALGQTHLALGNVMMTKGDRAGASEQFAASARIAGETGSERLLAFATHARGSLATLDGRADEAVTLFEEVVGHAEASGEVSLLAGAHYSLLSIYCALGRPEVAVTHGGRAASLYEQLNDLALAAAAFQDTANAYLVDLADSGKAAYGYRIALTYTRMANHPGEEEILSRLAACQGGPRTVESILASIAARDPFAQQLVAANPGWSGFADITELRNTIVGMARQSAEEPSKAFALWRTIAALSAEVDDRNWLAGALNEAGMICPDEVAATHYEQSCEIAKGVRDWRTFMMSAYNLGILRGRQGARDDAMEILTEAARAADLIQDEVALARIETATRQLDAPEGEGQ